MQVKFGRSLRRLTLRRLTFCRLTLGSTAFLLATAALAQTPPPPPPQAAARVLTPPAPIAPAGVRPISDYLLCDGNPNNMSAGESLARLVGAMTLLIVFAKDPEQPDPAKRKFGAEGVAACSNLIDGVHPEGNLVRRLPLILARAIHQIEAKNYAAAIADVRLARQQAKDAGVIDDPYFDRSMGLSFDMIEADALYAAGDSAGAREVAMRRLPRQQFSYYVLVGIQPYWFAERRQHPRTLDWAAARGRIDISQIASIGFLLELDGRFAEAAQAFAAMDSIYLANDPDDHAASSRAHRALDHALAGEWDKADAAIAEARRIDSEQVDAGKPANDRIATADAIDACEILRSLHAGDAVAARRTYAARSRWLALSLGQQLGMVARLRAGAAPAELTGSLAQTPEAMWDDEAKANRARFFERAGNNHTLFNRILPYAVASEYEAASKAVWRVDKSRLFDPKLRGKQTYQRVSYDGAPLTQPDAMLLHTALLARSKGFPGFTFTMNSGNVTLSFVRFGKPGDPDINPYGYFDAAAVIAELEQVIPSPETLAARRKPAK